MKSFRMRAVSLTLAVLLLGALGAGCSGNKKTSSSEPAKPVTIRYARWGLPEEMNGTKKILAAFQKENPNITVKLENSSWDQYWQKMQTEMASSTAPDAMLMDGGWYGNPATGAEVLGVHLEGPFINVRHKGAQNERYILEPSVPAFLDFVDGDLSGIRRVTLAPEIGEGIGLTRYLAQRGVCVSAGHTCASAEAFHASEKAGLKLCTHLYNGMEPMHHRTPGTVGAALASDEAYVEVIADLNHVAPDVLRLTAKAKDAGHCILITDSLSATGLGDGEYSLGGQKVTVQNGTARVESGSLAGSVIFLWQAVKNMAERVHVNLVSALRMATVNPARVIGVENRKGAVRPGFDADLNLLRDDLSVAFTMVRGRVVKA